MSPFRNFLITVLGAGCTLASINASAADTESQNPPRSQEQIMKERYAACHDLKGDALAECMANYVGKERNIEKDSTPTPPPPSKEPTQGDARR